jgi:hypothetical protein
MVSVPVEKITPKQEEAVLALLREPTVARAGESVGVPERTMHRWMRKPEFRRVYHRARREAFSQAIGLTQRLAPLAVQTLGQIMADQKAPTSSRVAAAGLLLRFGRDGIELEDLAQRVETLETAAHQNTTSRGQW